MALAVSYVEQMKSTPSGSEESSKSNHKQRLGIIRTLRSIPWRIGMALNKGYLRFQDWSGLFSYQDWYQIFEQTKLEDGDMPNFYISIIIKVTASNLHLYKDTCDSLIQQSYTNWEGYLILDDGAKAELPGMVQDEPRIKWITDPDTPSWKAGLDVVKGDWVVFMNSGDTLSADALAIIARLAMENPSAMLIYPDSDRLSENKLTRHNPRFWPDWSPDLLLSVNYLGSAFFRYSELSKTAKKTTDLETALLLCVEMGRQIIHIPRVLYHHRENQAKPWLEDSFNTDSLLAHLERIGLKEVAVQTSSPRPVQFTWEFGKPLISIIILTHDKVELLKQCLDSIFRETSYQNFEVILVENNSHNAETFAYYEMLTSNPRVKVLVRNFPFNFSEFNNWGVQHSTGEILLFLNNDIHCFEPGWMEELARWATRPEIGVVGAKLLYANGAIQHAGLVIGLEGHANHIFAKKAEGYQSMFGTDDWYRDYSAVTAACMMMRRNVFEQIGGFNEHYSLAFNDIELCQRTITAGYRVVYTPFARLIHREGATRVKQIPVKDIQLAYHQLKPLINLGDPYYNPNLSLLSRVPTLRRPGEIPAVKRLEQILKYLG
jgi:GT2 family glycosyltransferase